jgi:hypothetical protein
MSKHLVAFGGGVDSSALLAINFDRDAAAQALGISRQDLDEKFPAVDGVMFSDTGWERKRTYSNVDRFEAAYRVKGIPFYRVRNKKETILQWTLRLGAVPLMPGSSHKCSLKFKTEVMHSEAEAMFPGEKITWSIGIEANEDRRANKSFQDKSNGTHTSVYPLRNLGLDRADCEALIELLGWPKVVKSACVGCPFAQVHEIKDIIENEPEAWLTVKRVENKFRLTSPRKYQAFLDGGCKTDSAGRALAGTWKYDSWNQKGARLFAKKVDGRQLSTDEWEALILAGKAA